MEYRKNYAGAQNRWTDEELLNGLLKFKLELGRFPSASEIDSYEYLPSARSIQRSHGGLVNLKRRLLPDFVSEHDLTKGTIRSNKAREADVRAKKYEEEFYEFLCKHFSSIAVHEQKRIRPGDVSCDFYIYNDLSDGTVIDLFYSQDLKTMAKVVNIKLKRYNNLTDKLILFILVRNAKITQVEIENLLANRTVPLPAHIRVMNESYFKDIEVVSIKQKSKYSQV